SDAGWSELVRQLEYKSDWYGRELIKIDRFFPSSKLCGNCGFVIGKLPLSVREWECPQCNTTHDRDINAANNILAAGLAVSVCGANVRPDRLCSKGQLRNPPGIIDGGGQKQKPK
ncbi:MAG: transposase, partial [Prochloron sp. SP5CPC1]|nr:transposase [Candidatus Paraprochloron terpiosi SP5CPC1]